MITNSDIWEMHRPLLTCWETCVDYGTVLIHFFPNVTCFCKKKKKKERKKEKHTKKQYLIGYKNRKKKNNNASLTS